MAILFKEPVKGKREQIFTGDQAQVSRIWTKGKHNGLVERRSVGEDFLFTYNSIKGEDDHKRGNTIIIEGGSSSVLKYISTKVAGAFFPGNFVNYREIRIGKKRTNVYSDFVDDTTGASQRKREAMERYYRENNWRIRDRIRDTADKKEHELAPQLKTKIEEVETAGICMKHPEANYQIDSQGRIVFFEVDGIKIVKALDYAYRQNCERGIQMLALLGALMAKKLAKIERDSRSTLFEKVLERDLEETFDAQMKAFEEYKKDRAKNVPFSPIKIEYYFWREAPEKKAGREIHDEIAKVKNEKIERFSRDGETATQIESADEINYLVAL
jgi:hypothetical protein